MFAAITPRYDLLNRLLSFGRDRAWRRRAVDLSDVPSDGHVLDVCCGTGDVAFEFLSRDGFRGRVVGSDFCGEMLVAAAGKARRLTTEQGARLSWVDAGAEMLPFPDATFDVTTIAFGLRNMAEPSVTLSELARVTKPGGRLVVLELNMPPGRIFPKLFRFYFQQVSPRVGGWLSGHPGAYRYLPESVARFATPNALAFLIEQSGWQRCRFEALTGGVAYLHVAERARSRASRGAPPTRVAAAA